MDWMATMLAAAGASADSAYPLDGEDLMPVCSGRRAPYDRSLFWRSLDRDAARIGKWKYLKESGNEHLFDVIRDPGEKTDLKGAHPDQFERLKTQFLTWNTGILPRPA
jgi:arylsulfatase A-like enzyme